VRRSRRYSFLRDTPPTPDANHRPSDKASESLGITLDANPALPLLVPPPTVANAEPTDAPLGYDIAVNSSQPSSLTLSTLSVHHCPTTGPPPLYTEVAPHVKLPDSYQLNSTAYLLRWNPLGVWNSGHLHDDYWNKRPASPELQKPPNEVPQAESSTSPVASATDPSDVRPPGAWPSPERDQNQQRRRPSRWSLFSKAPSPPPPPALPSKPASVEPSTAPLQQDFTLPPNVSPPSVKPTQRWPLDWLWRPCGPNLSPSLNSTLP
jgi:hypothetical protein